MRIFPFFFPPTFFWLLGMGKTDVCSQICPQISSLKGRSQCSKWEVLPSPASGLLCRGGAINNQVPVGSP